MLVGHSYGGAVVSEAGTHPAVAALVYIAAFAPDKGELAGIGDKGGERDHRAAVVAGDDTGGGVGRYRFEVGGGDVADGSAETGYPGG